MDPGRLVDRARELDRLSSLYDNGGFGLLYGRRRIGKTRLVREWLSWAPRGAVPVYFQAGLWGHKQNLEDLAVTLSQALGDEALAGAVGGGLRGLLSLAYRLAGGRLVLVVDELGYWVRAAGPGVLSDLQYVVDHVLEEHGGVLLVTGSTIGVLQSSVLAPGSPLFARTRLRIHLQPLEPWCAPYFAPMLAPEGLARLYSHLGGVPYYLRLYPGGDPGVWFREAFSPGGELEDEAIIVMREEFREVHPYMSLLRALAPGPTTMGKAAQRAGVKESHASRYLATLEQVGLACRIPVIGYQRRSLWRVCDPMMRAWLVYAQHSWRQEAEDVIVAQGWEELALADAIRRAGSLGLSPSRVGRILRGRLEVDWAILDDEARRGLLVEATTGRPARREAEETLARALRALPWLREYSLEVLVYSLRGGGDVDAGQLPWGECS